jgi:hypothetical protein
MATYASGVSGWVVIPGGAGGQAGLIQRWDAEVIREDFDGTVFTDGSHINARKTLGGMHHLVGSCEAIIDDAAIPVLTHMQTEDASPTAGFELNAVGSTHGYTFSGILSRISLNVERRGQARVTMNFESSGAITRTVPA